MDRNNSGLFNITKTEGMKLFDNSWKLKCKTDKEDFLTDSDSDNEAVYVDVKPKMNTIDELLNEPMDKTRR